MEAPDGETTDHRSTEELVASGDRRISTNYSPASVVFDHGEGVYLYDRDGNAYLDFLAGIAVNCLGYDHPALVDAIREQAARCTHVSNAFYTAEQVELLEALTARTFADRVFFCNSGAEANEAALKLARRYQSEVAGEPDRKTIVSMEGSFHGRTMGAITATGQSKYHAGFEPMLPGVEYMPFGKLEAIDRHVGDQTAAVFVEPIQGEGGVRPADRTFLEGLRKRCDETGALLVFDEVQTGVGRTGELFAYQDFGVEPDIMCLAKGLGGGTPLGATLASDEIFKGWKPGSHASTFGGNPLVCRAAKTVLEVIDEQNLCENARQRGQQLRDGLRELQAEFDVIDDVRGRGLMVGAECGDPASDIVDLARDEGLLINTAGGDTLRFVPPLIVTEGDVDEALDRLERALAEQSGG
ncbi:MAG: acetylornithine transaminase [Bradymonadaceae bacterium]